MSSAEQFTSLNQLTAHIDECVRKFVNSPYRTPKRNESFDGNDSGDDELGDDVIFDTGNLHVEGSYENVSGNDVIFDGLAGHLHVEGSYENHSGNDFNFDTHAGHLHVEGSELTRIVSSTTSRKTGEAIAWLTMPPMHFSNFKDMIQYFKLQGWRVKKANKVGRKGQLYANFYCSHGGDSATYHRQVKRRQESHPDVCQKKIQHRSFGDPAAAFFCCPARLNAVYYNCEVLYKISTGAAAHNHSADRWQFCLKVAKKDKTMSVLDIIVRDARDNPILRANDLFVYFCRSVDSDFMHFSTEDRSHLKNVFGLLKRDMMKEVTELVRRARQEDKRLDLEFLLQAYLRDVDAVGEHAPRLIGLSYDYDNTTVLRRLCIVISTNTLLRRAVKGHNQALLIDGTHQTNTAGYKVITFGTEDVWRRYHLIALAITTEESISEISAGIESIRASIRELPPLEGESFIEWSPLVAMADGSAAITGAILKSFPTVLRLNCFYHVKASVKDRFEKILCLEDYCKLQADLSILASARDPEQFQVWVNFFLLNWQRTKTVHEYFIHKFATGNWQSSFFWGAGGILSLSNSRTNNSSESFNKALRNTWLRRSICSLTRLLGVFKGEQMEMESREGYTLNSFNSSDLESVYISRFNQHWKVAGGLLQDSTLRFAHAGDQHWSSAFRGRGKLYVFEHRNDHEISKLIHGAYNPFANDIDDPVEGFLTFVPDEPSRVLLPSPDGSVCLCETFVRENMCAHVLYVLCKSGRVLPPPGIVSVGGAVRSHGIRRPRDPNIGGRNCLQRLDGKRKAQNARNVTLNDDNDQFLNATILLDGKRKVGSIQSATLNDSHDNNSCNGILKAVAAMTPKTLFLAVDRDFNIDLFSFKEKDGDIIIGRPYWYDSETGKWASWKGKPATRLPVSNVIATHIQLNDGKAFMSESKLGLNPPLWALAMMESVKKIEFQQESMAAAIQEVRAVYMVKRQAPSSKVVIVNRDEDSQMPHGNASDGSVRILRGLCGGVTIFK